MPNRIVYVVLAAALMSLGRPTLGLAQCSTPAKKLAAALDGKAAFDAARAEATHWKADSVLIRMEATVDGPLTATGQARDWTLQFASPSGKQLEVIFLMAGEMSCMVNDAPMDAQAVGAQAVPITPDILLDTRRLFGIAQQAGGSKQDPQKTKVLAMLDKHAGENARWVVTYVTPQGMPVLTVQIDAQTGAVIK